MRRVWITDDRGRRVPLCGPGDLGPDANAYARLRVGRANGHRIGQLARPITAFAAGIGIVIFVRYVWGPPRLVPIGVDVLAPVTGAVFVAAIGIPLAWLYAIRHGARLARAACVKGSICSSCGYALAGLAPEADGCVVCPECAAAWMRTTG